MFTIKPYENELLSSWLFRIAKRNYTNVSSLLHYHFKNKNMSIKDIDLYKFNKKEIQLIKEIYSVSVKKHQLFKYNSYLEEVITNTSRHVWISTSNRNPYYKKFCGIRFCPLCLKEKEYFHDTWRIMLFNICEKHNCFLLNSCEKCHSKIIYANNSYDIPMYRCHNCFFDIRKSKLVFIKKNSKLFINHSHLKKILDNGYVILNNKWTYSFSYFYLLKFLVNIQLRVNNIHKYIEELSPMELSKYITVATFLLKNFPKRTNVYLQKNKLTNYCFIYGRYRQKINMLPNWFISKINYKKRIFNGHNFK